MQSTIPLEKASELTREYASYARDASGLGNVVGAVLILISPLLSHTLRLHPWERILLGSFPLLWIVAKELLRSRCYQHFGRVEPLKSGFERIYAVLLLTFSALISIICATLLMRSQGAPSFAPRLVASLLILSAVPFVVYRYLRGRYEFITGLFLMLQSASVLSSGAAAFAVGKLLEAPAILVALVMMFAGIEQHRRFLKLERGLAGCAREQG